MVIDAAQPLNLGDAYMALLNHGVATESGFFVRWINGTEWIDDLSWLQVGPPASERHDTPPQQLTDRLLATFESETAGGFPLPDSEPPANVALVCDLARARLYQPWDIALDVAWDAWQGVTDVILPETAISEGMFRIYLCLRLGFAVPRLWYIPLLAFRQEDFPPDVGNRLMTISGLRDAGWTPERVREMLARSCLKDPALGWQLWNLQAQPILDIGGSDDSGTDQKPIRAERSAVADGVAGSNAAGSRNGRRSGRARRKSASSAPAAAAAAIGSAKH
jgi:hypothetical protein